MNPGRNQSFQDLPVNLSRSYWMPFGNLALPFAGFGIASSGRAICHAIKYSISIFFLPLAANPGSSGSENHPVKFRTVYL